MKHRAFFSDIDGTLINRAHQLSDRTRRAVQRVIARGLPFVLVSARPPLAITPFTDAIGGKQPLIAFNGALILDGNLNPLHSITLDNADLRHLETLLENRPHLHPNYYRNLEWTSPNPDNPWTSQEGDITGLRATRKPEYLENIHKILVMGEAEAILTLEQQLKPQFPHLQIHRSKPTYLEIANKAASKSQAIAFMADTFGVSMADTVAFGDNYNDLDMLRAAGYSIAMGNAPDDIKAQADYVTADNDQDGLAQVLEAWFPAGSGNTQTTP